MTKKKTVRALIVGVSVAAAIAFVVMISIVFFVVYSSDNANQNATRPPTNNATNLASTTEEPITTTTTITTIEQLNMTTAHVYTSTEPAIVETEPVLTTIDDVTTNRPTTTATEPVTITTTEPVTTKTTEPATTTTTTKPVTTTTTTQPATTTTTEPVTTTTTEPVTTTTTEPVTTTKTTEPATTTTEPVTTTTTEAATTTTTTEPAATTTESDWILFQDHLYMFSDERARGQDTAQSQCLGLGANLLSIRNQDEHEFILANMERTGYWFGLTIDSPCNSCSGNPCSTCEGTVSAACQTCRNNWEWMDGEQYSFQNWQSNKPDAAGGGACARIFANGEWRNEGCSGGTYKYICKTRATEPVATTQQSETTTEEPMTTTMEYVATTTIQPTTTEQINQCESSPCAHGQCTDHVDSYICDCNPGYQGTNCDECIGVEYESKCYVVSTSGASWFDGRDACIAQGGTLAESCNAEINSILNSFRPETTDWIGGTYLDGEWAWLTNGCTFGDYAAWRPNQNLNPSTQRCITIINGEWIAGLCSYNKRYICEFN